MPDGSLRSELILKGTVGGKPLVLRGALVDGALRSVSGTAAFEAPLAAAASALGPPAAKALEWIECVLTPEGAGTPSSGVRACLLLDRLSVAFDRGTGGSPSMVQVVLTLSLGSLRDPESDDRTSCHLVLLLKTAGGRETDGAGFVAGVELHGLRVPGHLLHGLLDELSIGDLRISYASEEFPAVACFRPDAFAADGDPLPPDPPPRRFAQGFSLHADLHVAGRSLLGGEDGASRPEAPAPAKEPARGKGDASGPPSDGTKWIEIGKSLGPLSFRRLGLGYARGKVHLKLDAGLRVGCLMFSLEGFGIRLPTAALAHPKEAWKKLEVGLDGASLAFEQGPLSLSGGLVRIEKAGVPLSLVGALHVRTPALSISALAAYEALPGKPSFFAFAAIQRPLGGPAFFFVTGLAFGFGIHRTLRLPSIEDVERFPLVRAATDPEYATLDLRGIAAKLDACVAAEPGSYWIAAGVRFTSFGMIDSFALASVLFGTRLEIALLGLSRITVPTSAPGAPPPAKALARAELAIKVAFAPEAGLLSCEARLTDRSFVLRSDFQLRGGFAFYLWFEGPHAGDFVVTIGGYHPRFPVPAHYPRPDLVQFSCREAGVTIQGSCYFALCPSAIMAGGALSIVYESGGVRAWFVAHADLLLQWKPIHYDVDVAVSIGVSVNLKVLFVRVRLSVELAAAVTLYGPPLGGRARISLYVVSVTVSFGEARRVPPPLLWDSPDAERSFVKSFLPAGPQIATIAITGGAIGQAEGERAPHRVDAHGLRLACRSAIPITHVRSQDGAPAEDMTGTSPGVRPLGKTCLHSLLEIRCKPIGGAVASDVQFELVPIRQNVPPALWGAPRPPGAESPGEPLLRDVTVGVELRPQDRPPVSTTPPIELADLLQDTPPEPRRMPPPQLGPAPNLEALEVTSVRKTIADASVARRRAAVLEALRRHGRGTARPEEICVEILSDRAPYLFQAVPVPERAGQHPSRGSSP